jgi:hypothetical protein
LADSARNIFLFNIHDSTFCFRLTLFADRFSKHSSHFINCSNDLNNRPSHLNVYSTGLNK